MASKTPLVTNGGAVSNDRCKRRWNDLALVQLDVHDGRLSGGVVSQRDVLHAVRERFVLYLNCIESKPGHEPKHPYLYDLNH
mmetsp:Transcript_25749/g.89675  ORF Transcript_25749/g.89675 Transcript_25749/m.89675 type:complete len:82 (-) Transcript_25749:115-360(-)|eukprot:CAMPEP_0203815322 /NCGR_PEP_ID=MMETSP0115-20131106/10052_1 /ASSEMBLY_ACC=CAM_ASM_000227 /TAXON_ID=33651 /ORGANISM="Bicosoecid sp, Strain ms1" /LENGTH=81 /DNA_ID=CAMNT_0050724219 /DNA_START=31 /DNA_END=276 /DNA_ORIENTATION=-